VSDGEVTIEYGAIEIEGRWYPSLWLRGRENPSCTVCVGYSREEAIAMAKQEAAEEQARYVGDWSITVRERAADAMTFGTGFKDRP
jgi:hypothetical protein